MRRKGGGGVTHTECGSPRDARSGQRVGPFGSLLDSQAPGREAPDGSARHLEE